MMIFMKNLIKNLLKTRKLFTNLVINILILIQEEHSMILKELNGNR